MISELTVHDVADSVAALACVNPLFAGRDLVVTVIANEKAGGFTQKKKSRKNKVLFDEAKKRALQKESVTASVNKRVFVSEYPRHGEELASAEISQFLAANNPNQIHLVVAAGGDGTSLEVQTGLYKASLTMESKKKAVMNNIVVFRLPLGTGNDGTDGRTVEESLAILEGPNHLALSKVVTVRCNPQVSESEWYSFNIASIGLDAYVVYKTNQMKSVIPGNSYHLWVNLAALGYNFAFPPSPGRIELFDENGQRTEEIERTFEMLVFGLSGHRFYGGGHNILPNDHNVCIPPRCSAAEIAVLSGKFVDGSFVGTKYGQLFTANKAVLHYDHDLYCQLDGEEHLLTPAHFPVEMSITDPVIQIIESDDVAFDKGAVVK